MTQNSDFSDYEPLTRSQRSRGWEESESEWKLKNDQRSGAQRESAEPAQTNWRQQVGEEQVSARKQKENLAEPIKGLFLKRGHTLSFFFLFLFTAVVYFRPYEFFPALSALTSIAKWLAIVTLLVFLPTQLAIEGNLTARIREVNLVLLITLAALLSIPMAISPAEGWDHFSEYLKVVVMFVVMVNVVRTEGRLRLMFLLALAASVFMSIGALSDYQAGRLLVGGERIKGVLGGLFENPNDLALHLVTMVPIAITLFLARSGAPKKIIYGVCCLLMVAAVIVTFSRGGFLGLIAALLVLAWKLGRKHRAIVIVVSLVAILSIFALAPAEYGGRLSSIWGGDSTGSSNARQQLFWRSALVALRYPVLGVGIGNFHFKSLQEQVSHNSYTQVASEIGMTALVCYVLFMVFPLKNLKRIERETMGLKSRAKFYYLSVGLQASLVGYMVSSFFASVAFLWYVYYLVGYAVCLNRIYAAVVANESEVLGQEVVTTPKPSWNDRELPKVQAV